MSIFIPPVPLGPRTYPRVTFGLIIVGYPSYKIALANGPPSLTTPYDLWRFEHPEIKSRTRKLGPEAFKFLVSEVQNRLEKRELPRLVIAFGPNENYYMDRGKVPFWSTTGPVRVSLPKDAYGKGIEAQNAILDKLLDDKLSKQGPTSGEA